MVEKSTKRFDREAFLVAMSSLVEDTLRLAGTAAGTINNRMTIESGPITAKEGLMTTESAAELLCIAPKTLENWRSLRKGPAFLKVGSRVFYTNDDISAWLATTDRRAPLPNGRVK